MRFRIAQFAIALTAFSTAAQAGDGWRVVDTAGAVRVGGPGFMPIALKPDQELPADAWVETAAGGRAILLHGQETIIVEPNSRVQLPGEEVNGNTQVLQTLGSAIYKIGKQNKPHFQVDTPYLAAVVKGTAFTVNVSDDEASVDVTEGLVQVSTPDQTDIEFVRPGFTAQISRDHANDIVVDSTPPKSEQEQQPAPQGNAPKSDSGGTTTVSITEPIGSVDVNVKDVSGGIVFNDVDPVGTSDAATDDAPGKSEVAPGHEEVPGKVDDSNLGVVDIDIKDVPAHEAEVVSEVDVVRGQSGNSNAGGLALGHDKKMQDLTK